MTRTIGGFVNEPVQGNVEGTTLQESQAALGIGKWGLATLCVYTAVLAVTIRLHKPWADEAQSWLVARDLGFWQMLWCQVRYEASPGLWHTVLWIAARFRMPYAGLGWLSGIIAVAGIYVFLRWAPFPWPLRGLLPLTFFLQYQYAAIARSYVLFLLLGFLAAHFYRRGLKSVLLFSLTAGLLANTSVYGFIVGVGLFCAYVEKQRRARQSVTSRMRREAICGLICFFLLACLAVAVAVPPRDYYFAGAIDANDALQQNSLTNLVTAGLTRARILLAFPIAKFELVAWLVYLLVIWNVWVSKNTLLLLPLLGLIGFWFGIYVKQWHAGLLFVTVLLVLWITWPTPSTRRGGSSTRVLLLVTLLECVAVLQIFWTVEAVSGEIRGQYSGAAQAAAFVAQAPASKTIYGYHFYSVALQPYFKHNIFQNGWTTSFWQWREGNTIDDSYERIVRDHPDVVVIGWSNPLVHARDPARLKAVEAGYELKRQFCGKLLMRDGFAEMSCYDIFEPSDVHER